jgi:hypothetical protein
MSREQYNQVKELDDLAFTLGFRVNPSKFDRGGLALLPLEDSMPVFSRDTEFGFGSVGDLLTYLYGWQHCMEYLTVTRAISESRLNKLEDQIRAKRTLNILKNDKSN